MLMQDLPMSQSSLFRHATANIGTTGGGGGRGTGGCGGGRVAISPKGGYPGVVAPGMG